MANVKISQLPSLSTMTDLAQVPVVAGGTTYQITGANLSSYFNTNAGNITSTTDVNITIDTPDSSTFNWQFGADGSLTLPIGVSIDNNVGPLYPKIIADSGKLFSVQGQGNTGSAALAWTVNPNAASQYAAVAVTRAGGDNLAKVVLQAQSDSGNAATVKLWKFDETGDLSAPGNIIAPSLTTNNIRSDDSSFVNIEDGVNVTGAVVASGNITGNYFIGNGSQLTGINNSFAGEMHVSKDGNDSTGTGNILQPYLTIGHALTQVGGGRNTVVIHPGTYTENPTITSQATQLITYDATGASTLVNGTVTIANVTSRIAGLKMTNLAITGNAQAYINSSTVDGQFTKSSSGYVEVDDCELQVTGNVLISGSGTISIIGNKINNLVVNNAGAAVLVKGADDCVMPQVTAGSLNIVDSVIRASSNTANAVTASAGTVVTLMNNQIVTPAADNVARVSIAGYHSIISLVYDKANSTLSNSLNSVVYFQTANVDSLVSSGNITSGNLSAVNLVINNIRSDDSSFVNIEDGVNVTGAVIASGNITSGNINTGSRVVTTPVAFSTLTAVTGARAFVNDGNLVAATNFGAQVSGGGANTVPVWSDGTNWYIG